MKLSNQCMAAITVLAVLSWTPFMRAQFFGGAAFDGAAGEQSGTFIIRADGSCGYTGVNVQSRAAAEQQVRMMERYENASDNSDENSPQPTPAAGSKPEVKPLTDEELVKKLESLRENGEYEAENPDVQFKVTITNGNVRTESTQSFASIHDMLAEGSALWEGTGIFESARFELDSNAQLRVTLTTPKETRQLAKTIRTAMKMSGYKVEFRLVLPGKVITSSFPETDGNATGFRVDGKKDESIDAMMKLYDAPVVITADAGGLKIPEPLDSKELQRTSQAQGGMGSDLPITDAGSGFVAEAQTITTTMIHVFPDGENYFETQGENLGQQAGAVITAKFFAPKGRTLQSVSGARVLKAIDDQGRDVAPAENENDEETSLNYSTDSGETRADSAPVQLSLQLPAPDAKAINEVDGEVIAITAGTWSEMSLTNLQENATNEIDLSAVLPGAKLVVKKMTSRIIQTTVMLEVKGPRAVQRLDFKAKIPGVDQMNSSVLERHFGTKAGVSTRALSIQTYRYGDQQATGPMFIVVRCPQDLRRERVKFKLTALDLL